MSIMSTGRREEERSRKIFKNIVAEKFQNMMKTIKVYVQKLSELQKDKYEDTHTQTHHSKNAERQ